MFPLCKKIKCRSHIILINLSDLTEKDCFKFYLWKVCTVENVYHNLCPSTPQPDPPSTLVIKHLCCPYLLNHGICSWDRKSSYNRALPLWCEWSAHEFIGLWVRADSRALRASLTRWGQTWQSRQKQRDMLEETNKGAPQVKGLSADLEVTSALRDDQIKFQPIRQFNKIKPSPETSANDLNHDDHS